MMKDSTIGKVHIKVVENNTMRGKKLKRSVPLQKPAEAFRSRNIFVETHSRSTNVELSRLHITYLPICTCSLFVCSESKIPYSLKYLTTLLFKPSESFVCLLQQRLERNLNRPGKTLPKRVVRELHGLSPYLLVGPQRLVPLF